MNSYELVRGGDRGCNLNSSRSMPWNSQLLVGGQVGRKRVNSLSTSCGSWFKSDVLCSCQSQSSVIYNSLKFQYKKHIAAGRLVSFPYIGCHFLGNIIIKMSGITASARNIFRFQDTPTNSKFKGKIIKCCMTNFKKVFFTSLLCQKEQILINPRLLIVRVNMAL